MKISSRVQEGVTILDIDGDIKTAEDMETFSTAIDNELKENRTSILINFEKVKFINSSGLGRLVLGVKKVTESGGSLRVMNLANNLDELFTFTRLKEKINVYKNEEEALEGFKSS